MNYFAKTLRVPGSWKHNVRFTVSANGDFDSIMADSNANGAEIIDGIVIPGMPNLHSHSFQRAMIGMSEFVSSADDDFWSWRKLMYQCANEITPAQLWAITAQLYVEMLKAGYTGVAEFHYLHHDTNGVPFENLSAQSEVIVDAATSSGIGLTLLPTLYQTSSFDNQAPRKEQQRFINSLEQYSRLIDQVIPLCSSQTELGLAAHSLRSVNAESLSELNSLRNRLGLEVPLHIHIAEQEKEVLDCVEHYGSRPLEWLCNNFDIDDSWSLIHATHINEHELNLLAERQCIVGLCPTTEANLGDGVFPLKSFLEANGVIGIGSDSQISVNPIEELRWLEYSQRLHYQKRNRLTGIDEPHNGTYLWEKVIDGGSKACGRATDGIKVNNRADFLVLDDSNPLLYSKQDEYVLDALIFAGNTNTIKDVMVGGNWVVRQGNHIDEVNIKNNFYDAISSLMN